MVLKSQIKSSTWNRVVPAYIIFSILIPPHLFDSGKSKEKIDGKYKEQKCKQLYYAFSIISVYATFDIAIFILYFLVRIIKPS